MRIYISSLPHKHQRYNTLGDWQWKHPDYAPNPTGDDLTIYVSETGDINYNFLIAIHELIEAFLCHANSISEEEVDKFDMSHPELEDPGSDARCPYLMQHMIAESIEVMLATQLGVDWASYYQRLKEISS